MATGPVTRSIYTGPTGTNTRVGSVARTPMLVRLPVRARATVRDVTVRASTSWVLSPRLADGRAGFRAGMRDRTVVAGQQAVAVAVARDAAGNPVPNLLVTFTWDYGRTEVRVSAWTDATGRARSSRLIRSTTTRNEITVRARVQSGSVNRASSTSLERVD